MSAKREGGSVSRLERVARRALASLLVLLAACGSAPPAPQWQSNAKAALDRAVAAYLGGDTRVANAEFDLARRELARTGRADLVAMAELTRCAVRVASLDVAPCEGFEKLRSDATPAERAYADYPDQSRSGRGRRLAAGTPSPVCRGRPRRQRGDVGSRSRRRSAGTAGRHQRAVPGRSRESLRDCACGGHRIGTGMAAASARLAGRAACARRAGRGQRRRRAVAAADRTGSGRKVIEVAFWPETCPRSLLALNCQATDTCRRAAALRSRLRSVRERPAVLVAAMHIKRLDQCASKDGSAVFFNEGSQ